MSTSSLDPCADLIGDPHHGWRVKHDQLDLDAVKKGIKRPSCRNALGLLGVGLSVFAWPYFPDVDARIAFASTFSLGAGGACAWLGGRIDAAVRQRNRARRSYRRR